MNTGKSIYLGFGTIAILHFLGIVSIPYMILGYEAEDSDKDGIADQRDLCPDTPRHEIADLNGCSCSQLPNLCESGERCFYNFSSKKNACTKDHINPYIKIVKRSTKKLFTLKPPLADCIDLGEHEITKRLDIEIENSEDYKEGETACYELKLAVPNQEMDLIIKVSAVSSLGTPYLRLLTKSEQEDNNLLYEGFEISHTLTPGEFRIEIGDRWNTIFQDYMPKKEQINLMDSYTMLVSILTSDSLSGISFLVGFGACIPDLDQSTNEDLLFICYDLEHDPAYVTENWAFDKRSVSSISTTPEQTHEYSCSDGALKMSHHTPYDQRALSFLCVREDEKFYNGKKILGSAYCSPSWKMTVLENQEKQAIFGCHDQSSWIYEGNASSEGCDEGIQVVTLKDSTDMNPLSYICVEDKTNCLMIKSDEPLAYLCNDGNIFIRGIFYEDTDCSKSESAFRVEGGFALIDLEGNLCITSKHNKAFDGEGGFSLTKDGERTLTITQEGKLYHTGSIYQNSSFYGYG